MPVDRLSRNLCDLRISVTDRCNLRCSYCMPREVFGPGYAFLHRDEVLTFEEITRVAGIFVKLGVRKIRITGGEPLLRREVSTLVRSLASIQGLSDLAMTTNGILLGRYARELKDAGLSRLTVSLDSVDPAGFARVSGSLAPLDQVLSGISAATSAGFHPIKINCVVQRGVNDQAVIGLVRHFKGSSHILRFIEYMDVGNSNGWQLDQVVPSAQVVESIHREMPLEPIAPAYPGEVARRWRFQDGEGEIGVVASVTQPFCRHCSRMRLSPDGKIFTCLFASVGHDVRALLRSGATDQEIEQVLTRIWEEREDRYSEVRTAETAGIPKVEMSYIGG